MNKLVVIPVCNFFDILNDLIYFYDFNLEEADIVIVDDSTNLTFSIPYGFNNKNIFTINNNNRGNLGLAFLSAIDFAENLLHKKYDLIITNEHDVKPRVDALYACLSVFENDKIMKDVASVSTIYKWNGVDCYPSHPDWYNGWSINNVPGVGQIKVLGAQGVPFGFTLWRPEAIKLLSTSGLPKIWKLDSEFGKLLKSKGYYHLRLVDYFVEHINGGVKSWKNK